MKSFYFYSTNPDETIQIIKYFSSSPNSLPTPKLKNSADVLSFLISDLVNLSLTNREFPNLCKIAKGIPLYKNGDPFDSSNYRPISLLSTFSKIFEKCVYKCVYSFLEEIYLSFKWQFGFSSSCSANHIKVNLVESVKKYIDNNDYICNVFIDLQKAFDTVDHQVLLQNVTIMVFEV